MSNSWEYKLHIDNSLPSRERVERLLQTLRSHRVRYDSGGVKEQFRVWNVDDELELESEADLVNYLSLKGGGFTAWMTVDPEPEGGVGFSVYYQEKSLWDPYSSDTYASTVGEISLIIPACEYRSSGEDHNRVIIAPFIKSLFKSLCMQQDAIYGYSVDEYTAEALGLDWPVPALVYDLSVPKIYWLNYFSNRYLSKIAVKDMKSLGGIVEEVRSGVFISLFHHPWEVETSFQRLIDANEIWRRITDA